MNICSKASQPRVRYHGPNFSNFAFRLEASLAAVRADPSAECVRHLRACGRHVSAELVLFKLSEPPSYRKVVTKGLNHLLKKLDKASGRVRRIDAQEALLKSASSLQVVSCEGQRLQGRLKRKRKPEIQELRHCLKRLQKPLNKRLTRLMILFGDEPPAHLTDSLLYRIVSKWFRDKARCMNISKASTQELHTIRKAAKTARYMAETSDGPRVRRLAAGLKEIQNAGGAWHDRLQLHSSASRESGKHSALSKSLHQSSKAADTHYRKIIAGFRF